MKVGALERLSIDLGEFYDAVAELNGEILSPLRDALVWQIFSFDENGMGRKTWVDNRASILISLTWRDAEFFQKPPEKLPYFIDLDYIFNKYHEFLLNDSTLSNESIAWRHSYGYDY